jgi:hypothetical protein
VAGLSLRRAWFNSRPDHVRYVVDTVAMGQVFLPALRCSLVSIIPQMLHNYIHVNTRLIRRTGGRGLERSNNAAVYRNVLLLSPIIKTNKCTNMYCIILKLALKHLKSSYMFRSIDRHQGAHVVPC